MTKSTFIIISILSLTFIRCADKTNPYKDFKLPDSKEYNDIIFAILKQDTICVSPYLLEKEFIGPELGKTQIEMQRPDRDTSRVVEIAFPTFKTSVLELKYYKITDSINLKVDSVYFAFQNDSAKVTQLDTSLIDFAKFTTVDTIRAHKGKPGFGYLHFSTPVLNKDHSKALVRANFLCYGLCGGGWLFLLDKKNGKWVVTKSKSEWVS